MGYGCTQQISKTVFAKSSSSIIKTYIWEKLLYWSTMNTASLFWVNLTYTVLLLYLLTLQTRLKVVRDALVVMLSSYWITIKIYIIPPLIHFLDCTPRGVIQNLLETVKNRKIPFCFMGFMTRMALSIVYLNCREKERKAPKFLQKSWDLHRITLWWYKHWLTNAQYQHMTSDVRVKVI